MDGITGSSVETNHPGWMAINSMQCGLGRSISGSGGSGRSGATASFSEITFSKKLDAASPQLALHAAGGGGDSVSNGTMDIISLNHQQARYLRLNLTNILVSSYSQSTGGEAPTESFSLAPLIFSWNYTEYDPASGFPSGYVYGLWNPGTGTTVVGTNNPPLVTTGIRLNGGVQLSWPATAGHAYRIFAATDLKQPFVPIATITAGVSGDSLYTFTPTAPAMFYTVEEIPAGY